MSNTSLNDDYEAIDESLGLIHASNSILLLAVLPLLALAGVSKYMGLDLVVPMVIGSIRAALQLLLCGYILTPVFWYGDKPKFMDFGWLLVFLYTTVMVCLACWEVNRRSKYCFRGMYPWILMTLMINIGLVACFAFGVLLKPDPLWDPKYVIPIVGMLLGNCINGVALSLDHALTGLMEQATEIDLLLAFGATLQEATSHLVRDSVRVGAVPAMNALSVIGIVSIPGMMTGQILGGSPVIEAARYQILITYLIATCSLCTILSQLFVLQRVTCDFSQQRLKLGIIQKRGNRPGQKISHWVQSQFQRSEVGERSQLIDEESVIRKVNEDSSKTNRVEIVCTHSGAFSTDVPVLEVHKASLSFPNGLKLFHELSYTVAKGSLYALKGPSGSGKSQLLRLIAALTAMDDEFESDLILHGQSRKTLRRPETWRRMVRYVAQSPVNIPGTPRQFIKRIVSLRSWTYPEKGRPLGPTEEGLFSAASNFAQEWGLQPSIAFDSEWKQLSGGEAQRVFVAICIASKPTVLLMDESTSALDMDTKIKVEEAVLRVAREDGISILWVSHDEEQLERFRSDDDS